MIRLQGLKGCCEGEAFEFDEATIILGRSSACDLTVDDPSCSRQHAAIELADDGYKIRDLGSTNGIKLNGEKVRGKLVPIVYGDRFALGRNLFIFLAKIPSDDTNADAEDELGVTDLVDVGDVENRLTRNLTDLTHVIKAGSPVVSAEELEDLQRTHQQMHFVYRVSRALNSTLERDGLLEIILATYSRNSRTSSASRFSSLTVRIPHRSQRQRAPRVIPSLGDCRSAVRSWNMWSVSELESSRETLSTTSALAVLKAFMNWTCAR